MKMENGQFILEDITIKEMFCLDNICEDLFGDTSCNNKKMLTVCQEYLEAILDEDQLTRHAWYLSLHNLLGERVWFDVNVDHVVYFADSFIILHDEHVQKEIKLREKRRVWGKAYRDKKKRLSV